MRKIEFKPTFKKELSNVELFGIEHILNTLGENCFNSGEMLGMMAYDYGLAYTSSSSYAMYNVTNEVIMAYTDTDLPIYLSHIALTHNDMVIMVGYDSYENTVMYEIEMTDL